MVESGNASEVQAGTSSLRALSDVAGNGSVECSISTIGRRSESDVSVFAPYASTMHVRIGTCGFAEARARLFQEFDIVEVQQTFYQPPRVETAIRWRDNAPAGFVSTLKAW